MFMTLDPEKCTRLNVCFRILFSVSKDRIDFLSGPIRQKLLIDQIDHLYNLNEKDLVI